MLANAQWRDQPSNCLRCGRACLQESALMCCVGRKIATQWGEDSLIFERIEWDDANLEHATVRVSAAEIEQAIWGTG